MTIELRFKENMTAGETFRIPVDSEADEFLSGKMDIQITDKKDMILSSHKMTVTTDCTGVRGNPAECLLLLNVAISDAYRNLTGEDINAPK